MSETNLPQYIQDLLGQICTKNSFNNYSIQVESGSQVGDGFSSELTSAEITESASQNKLNIVIKTAPLNKNRQKEFFSKHMFEREIYFYDKVMPTFAKFQEEKMLSKEDQFATYPKCYGTLSDDENSRYVIILEDLRPAGFKMWNKAKAAPFENVKLTMRELGKFHGISIALKHQRPEVFAEFKQLSDGYTSVLESENVRRMFEASFDRAIASLQNEDYKNVMQTIKNKMGLYFHSCVNKDVSDRFGVVSHGDLWNNNILYKFNANGNAEEIRILDWQVLKYVSPAIDLVHNLFTSTDKALRDMEYDNLIKIYYESLSKTVCLLGSNPDELFTFENLQDELKTVGTFALLLAPIVLQACHADPSNVPNLDEMFDRTATEGTRIELISDLNAEAQLKCGQRLSDVIEDILKFGYFQKID